ncbi:monofunctional biosynthetic peptidoglycan transglycosylase [Hymenobacter lutimineralis]|uniref:Biosynthetic peptidoglycan transglycosylase n=1 Tax=Hymenobacter lutimineralis TaxID=2606448 RepID=A0A5D6URM7_9BACT|nr:MULTISPECIES: monofunctional biosynthetic peptidoglycan transglycosylase [Hymenobacter]QIX59673.1 monofunctional biosynthetic peptidoglycan transglycosylase [Hymenobacter sp. BT18]TYZ06351.1 monofunctional biosynthetic peptidoglycan transglycosylase [Hymenobacter lutimineralis]
MADFKLYWRRGWQLVLQVGASLLLTTVVWVLLYRWVSPPATWLMLERRSHRPEGYQHLEDERQVQYSFVSMEEVSPQLPLALVAAEDQRFLIHHGFDVEALKKAAQRNMKGGSKQLVGGSTISQQVAKNVFLWNGRSYIRKAAEAYFTVLIELFWSKQRILEMYLNVAEMGDCTFGAEAAAQRYFHKSAAKLTPSEAALLAAILPNPLRFRAASPGPQTRAKQRRVLRNMRRLGGTRFVQQVLAQE